MHRLRLVWWSLVVLALTAIAYGSRLAEGKPDRDVLYRYSTAVGSAVVYGIMLLVVLAIAGFRRELLGLRRPRSWPAALGLSLLLLVGVYVAIALIDPILQAGREQGLTPTGWQPDHAEAYAANFVVVAGLAPVVEELMFRGLGYSLLERFGRWPAILAVGIAFALAHGLVNGFVELALFGCALAWLRSRTRSVYPGILLHSVFNAIALVAAVTI